MTKQAFHDWFRNIFLPYLPPTHPDVLLILDGHTSHISYELCQLAIKHKVNILKLPAHVLQPLDVGVFQHIKAAWSREVSDFTRRERRPVTKSTFPALIHKVWLAYKPEYGKSAFKRTGIYPPFNKDAIPSSAIKFSEPFHGLSTSQSTPTESQNIPSLQNSLSPDPENPPSTTTIPDIAATASILDPPLSSQPSNSNTAPTSNNELPPTSSSSAEDPGVPATTSTAIHVPVWSPPAASTSSEAPLPSVELRHYFGGLLQSRNPTPQQIPRRRLTGIGQSMTSDEVMAQLQAEEKAKQDKEREKLENKRKREEKRKNKQEKAEKAKQEKEMKQLERKRKREDNQKSKKKKKTQTCTSIQPQQQVQVLCLECETYYDEDTSDEDWVQCERCLGWYHQTCAGLDSLTQEEIDNLEFVCC